MDENSGTAGFCKKCGKVLNSDDLYCGQCQVELAEEDIDDIEEEIVEENSPGRSRRKRAVQLVILAVLIGVIILQAPKFFAAFDEPQPIRKGTYETDAQTDLCISNLWQISRMLEEGTLPDSNIACPESGKPYIVIEDSVNTTVLCPNPQQHGLMEIRVSKLYPCPEVKQ